MSNWVILDSGAMEYRTKRFRGIIQSIGLKGKLQTLIYFQGRTQARMWEPEVSVQSIIDYVENFKGFD
ncbi:MAG: hypothetical protein R3213_07850 [Flavobacteriaceae bacterium]|nr:hypothetical protein [Flavobacteriaceae bacterium]